jgi:hypothetical protein
MKNSNKRYIVTAVALLVLVPAKVLFAGEITEYDNLNFITYQSGKNIKGYYRAINGIFSCQFMFMADQDLKSRDETGVVKVPIKTFDFVPHKNAYSYGARDPRSDITGELYLYKGELALKTDSPHGGCRSSAGFFGAEPGERGASRFSATKTYPSLGIGVVARKSFLYENPGNGKQRSYVTAGDYVTLIRNANGFTYVRFVNPDMQIDDDDKRKVTTGWVHSSDLMNPFPPASQE